MTLNTNKKRLFFLCSLLILFVCSFSCKEKSELEDHKPVTIKKNEIDSVNIIKTNNPITNKEEWKLYRCYYFNKDEYDNPSMTEENVLKKFQNIKIFTSKDSLWINNKVSGYQIKNKDNASKYFRRSYEYENAIKSFKYGFDMDIKDKPISYIWLDPEKYLESPFSDNFNEGGSAIIIHNYLFLKNYEGYMICFKKDNKNNILDKKYCELPFYSGREHSLCQYDDRNNYAELCNNEYPIFYFKKDRKLEAIIKTKIPNKNLLYYYNIKTNIKDVNTLVVITKHEEESYGDLFLVNLKDNDVISILNDEKNDYFHSMNFEIKNDLSITVFNDNGMRPKEKIVNTYKINSEGDFIKIK